MTENNQESRMRDESGNWYPKLQPTQLKPWEGPISVPSSNNFDFRVSVLRRWGSLAGVELSIEMTCSHKDTFLEKTIG